MQENIYNKVFRRVCSWETLFLAVLISAAFARLYKIGENSFWFDESWVALTVREPDLKDMFFPDYWVQTTPSLFLLASRALAGIFGYSETVFRLMPAAAGISSILFLYLLAKKLLRNKLFALLSATAWAFSDVSLRYSQEFRPYALEAFCAVTVLYFAEEMFTAQAAKDRNKYFIAVTAASLLFIGFSNSVIFVLPVIGLRMLWHSKKHKGGLSPKQAVFYSVSVLAVFSAYYSFLISRDIEPWMMKYWDYAMISSKEWGNLPVFFLERMSGLFGQVFPERWDFILFGHAIFISTALFAAGILYLAHQRNMPALNAILLPIIIGFAISVFDMFPFGTRQSIYLAPLIIVGISAGVEFILLPYIRHANVFACGLIMFLVVALPLRAFAVQNMEFDHPVEDVKTIVEWFKIVREPDDYVVVLYRARFAFEFYDKPLDEQKNIESVGYFGIIPNEKHGWKKSLEDAIDNKLNNGRIWIIFGANLRKKVLYFMEQKNCEIIKEKMAENASGYLFRCG